MKEEPLHWYEILKIKPKVNLLKFISKEDYINMPLSKCGWVGCPYHFSFISFLVLFLKCQVIQRKILIRFK